jgi:hypothetical protein
LPKHDRDGQIPESSKGAGWMKKQRVFRMVVGMRQLPQQRLPFVATFGLATGSMIQK